MTLEEEAVAATSTLGNFSLVNRVLSLWRFRLDLLPSQFPPTLASFASISALFAANPSSSTSDNNFSGPGLSTWHTFPEMRSCNVDFGTPCILAAYETGVFLSITDFIAAFIASILHCFCFLPHFSMFTVAGADIDLGLLRFLWPFGNKGFCKGLELRVTVFDTPTNVDIATRREFPPKDDYL